MPKRSIAWAETRHKSNGTMDRNFQFPPASEPPPVPAVPQIPPVTSPPSSPSVASGSTARSAAVAPAPDIEHGAAVKIITPSSAEVPPPPPVEKENRRVIAEEDTKEDVGDTVEIDLR
jgi:hypothetical protein